METSTRRYFEMGLAYRICCNLELAVFLIAAITIDYTKSRTQFTANSATATVYKLDATEEKLGKWRKSYI